MKTVSQSKLLCVVSLLLALAGCNSGSSGHSSNIPNGTDIKTDVAATTDVSVCDSHDGGAVCVRAYLNSASVNAVPSGWITNAHFMTSFNHTNYEIESVPYAWTPQSTGLCLNDASNVLGSGAFCGMAEVVGSYYTFQGNKLGIAVGLGTQLPITNNVGIGGGVLVASDSFPSVSAIQIKSGDGYCDIFANNGKSSDSNPTNWWNYSIPSPDRAFYTFSATISQMPTDKYGGTYAVLTECSLKNDSTGQVVAGDNPVTTNYYNIQNNLNNGDSVKLLNARVGTNPDNDDWIVTNGSVAGAGKSLAIGIKSPDRFQKYTVMNFVNHHYAGFNLNTAGMTLQLGIFDSQGNQIDTCSLNNNVYITALHGNDIALNTNDAYDRVFCNSGNYYVQDDQNQNHTNTLFVNRLQAPTTALFNVIVPEAGYQLKLESINVVSAYNSDNDSWTINTGIGDDAQTMAFSVTSPDAFAESDVYNDLNYLYGDFSYNSSALLNFQLWENGSYLSDCQVPVFINGGNNQYHLPQIAIKAPQSSSGDAISPCKQYRQAYFQDEGNTPGQPQNSLVLSVRP